MKVIRRNKVNSVTTKALPPSWKRHKEWVDSVPMTEIHENLQNQRRGLDRVIYALGYSLQRFRERSSIAQYLALHGHLAVGLIHQAVAASVLNSHP
jgi:hypothetical protein